MADGRGLTLAFLGTTALALVAGLGCSDDDQPGERSCTASDHASVCLVRHDGTATVEVEGLRPGSEIRVIPASGGDPLTQVVNEAGGLDGTLGLVPMIGGPLDADVTATAADGTQLEGTLSLPGMRSPPALP